MDGDGDLDVLAGNNNQVNKVYRNDGNGVFTDITAGDLATHVANTKSVAWGDMDGDGDLDILAGNSIQVNKVYRNTRNDGILTSNQPLVEIQLPEQIVGVNNYGVATIVAERVIDIPFTLQNAYEVPIGGVTVEYSLNGGGMWLPAISATDTMTSPLLIGEAHIFQWDTLASGFFGQSDNVVIRMITHPQIANGMSGTFNYPNMAAGPIMYGSTSATTTPFRVRGTQVRVFSETVTLDNAVSEAIVYRSVDGGVVFDVMGNDETAFETDLLGYLQGRGALGLGDQVVALLPISETENYTLYHTSAMVGEQGFADAYTVSAAGVQTLTVSADNPLAVFDLTVSLEWDARNDLTYLNQLESDLKRASEILYDLTNGQAALGEVTVYHEREQWNQADLVIHASNGIRPSAIAGGIVVTATHDIDAQGTLLEDAYVPGQIRMGPTWNRFGEASGTLGEDWPRTLAHELGHYLFFLPDNYLGINPDSGLLSLVDCVGSAMTDPYTDGYSELLTASSWNGDCLDTLAEVYMGRNDWETINTFYPMLDGTTTNLGPNYLPLNLTQVTFVEPVTPTTTLADPFFSLVTESGGAFPIASGRGDAFLIKTGNDGDPTNDYVQALGSPVGSIVHARGAAVGDRLCVYDYSSTPLYAGCVDALDTFPTPITLRLVADWQPEIRVTEVNSQTFAITTTNVAESNMMVQLLPTFGAASAETPMTPNGNDFSQTITLPEPAFAGYVRVWVPGSNPPQELIVDFISIEDWGGKALSWGGKALSWGGKALSWGGKALSWGAPTLSSDGQVSLFPLDNPFADTTVYNLQKLSFLPTLDAWLIPIGQAYRVEVDGDMPASSIIFRYLGRDVDHSYENDLAVYFSADNAQTWQRLSTEVDPTRNHAVAAAAAEGIYVLALTIESAELHVGWNNVAYGVQTTRPVTVALASIDGSYTSVYWHDDANAGTWLLYDSTVEPPFADIVNTLESISPDAYWIYATEPATWYVGVEQQSQRSTESASTTFAPPATYYGWVHGAEVGDVISVEIDGTLCGQTTAVTLDGEVAYSLHIVADNPFGQSNGCGLPQGTITFLINGVAVAQTTWDHTQAWQLDLESSVPTNIVLNDRAATTQSSAILIVIVALTTLLSGLLAIKPRR